MGLKRCDKCEEMVDEAKAFCPACGNAFVEEEKREASDLEKMDSTVQLGQTMYNQMLSDMGLNISRGAPAREKRVEVIEPLATAPVAENRPPAVQPRPSKTIWIVLGALLLMVVLAIVVVAAAAVFFLWPRVG